MKWMRKLFRLPLRVFNKLFSWVEAPPANQHTKDLLAYKDDQEKKECHEDYLKTKSSIKSGFYKWGLLVYLILFCVLIYKIVKFNFFNS